MLPVRFARTLAVLALAALAGCTLLPANGGVELRVMSWNLRPAEGHVDLDRVGAEITAAQCDLVALQEVGAGTGRSGGEEQVAELARRTGMHPAFAAASERHDGVGVLSRWPIAATHAERLRASAGREVRVALSVCVDVPGHGPLWFACVQFDDATSPADRVAQARALVERARRARPGEARAADVLAGALNDVGDGPTLAVLEEVWIDAYGALEPTWPAASPRRRLDHVLVRRDAGIEVATMRVLETTASDHRPVLAMLRLPPRRGDDAATAAAVRPIDGAAAEPSNHAPLQPPQRSPQR